MSEDIQTTFATPFGRLSYPVLYKGRLNQQGVEKWGVQILVTPEIFQKECGLLLKALDELGKAKFGKSWSLKTAKNKPIQKTDEMEVKDERTKGYICIKTTANNPPIVVGPDKNPLTPEAIQRIKGGHWGKAIVNAYAYDVAGNKGVSLGLNVLQYWKPDDEFGTGAGASLALLDAVEVPVSDIGQDSKFTEADVFL